MKRITLLCLLSLCLAVPALAAGPSVAPSPIEHLLAPDGVTENIPPAVVTLPSVADAVADPVPVVVPQPDDMAAFAGAVLAAVQAKNWAMLVALGLVLLVWAARKFGGKFWPFLTTDRGGALLSLVGGLALSIAAAAAAPGASGIGSVLLSGLLMAATASGTYALLRKLLFPSGVDHAQEIDASQAAAQSARPTDAAAVAERVNAGLGR
jgi:hypothetical protein